MKLDGDTERQVSASLLRICSRSAFFATLALFARFEASRSIPTAATDGRTIFVNSEFWGKLNPAERDGVLLHEVLHAALEHVPRRAGREAQLWNIAADVVVNGVVLREGLALPQGGIRDANREHLSTEEVYELLLREAERVPMQPIQTDLLDGTPQDAESAQGQGKERLTSPSPRDKSRPGEESPAADDGYWRNALEQARIVAKTSVHGKIPAGLERELGTALESRLDWRTHLWRYLTQTPNDFQDFDRRFVGQGLYLDTLAGETVQVLVAVDTSGSVGEQELQQFVGEVQGILRAYPHLRCDLYYADAALHGPYALKPNSKIPPPTGGGGTDFRPFFDKIARHPFTAGRTVAIYLTDGYGDFPDRAPRVPVLWVVTPGGLDSERFPFGQVVQLLISAPTPFIKSRGRV